MRLHSLFLLLMLSVGVAYANLNDGHQKGQKILFVRLDAQAAATSPTNMAWVAGKFNAHHTVVQRNNIPADLSSYDQVWDIRWANSNTRVLSDAEITRLKNFMQNDSGSVFLLGENDGFGQVNSPIINFVNSVTKEGGFAASGIGKVGNSGNGWNNTIVVNAPACDSAENFDTDFSTGWGRVWTEVPGLVKKTEMAGGNSVLHYNSWAGAVAWTHDKLKPAYAGGKLVVFFDSQAFHCWASTQWGLSNLHKNNLKFFWNALDFLTKTVPQASLTVTPTSADTLPYRFNGPSLGVSITTDAGNQIQYRQVSASGTSAWDTLSSNSGTVQITGDATLEVQAFGPNYLTTSGAYEYEIIKTAPFVVTHPITEITYHSANASGEVTADGGDSVTVRGICWGYSPFPDTSGTTILDSNSGIGGYASPLDSLDAERTIYVRAYAINGQGITYGNEVQFTTPAKPTALLSVTPGSSTYTTSTLEVVLATDSGNVIYYTTDGTLPDTTDSTQLLDAGADSGTVTIKGDATLRAIALGSDYSSTTGSWSYICELPLADLSGEATLESGPQILTGTIDTVHYGHDVTLALTSTALNLEWIFGTDPQDTLLWETYQSPIILADTTTLPASDTIVISARAYDDDHSRILKTYVFVRDTVQELQLTPSGKFSDTLPVTLSLSQSWNNSRIYYTTNGSTPDSNSLVYTNTLVLDTTTTITAIAYADDAIESQVLTATYILANSAKSAQYIDGDANGAIDQAVIELSFGTASMPDSLSLRNPFDTTEQIIAYSQDMTLEGTTLTVALTQEFYDGSTHSTAIVGGLYGSIYGDSYHEAPFSITDGVAPLVLSATYQPGTVTRVDGAIQRDEDTLFVTFTEAVTPQSLASATAYFALENSDYGTPYSLDLQLHEHESSRAVFIVKAVSGVEYPQEGDDISIDIHDALADLPAGNIQYNADNRPAELEVIAIEVKPEIFALNPVNPRNFSLPGEFEAPFGNGVAFVVDYLIALPQSVQDSLSVEIALFDAVGNTITRLSSELTPDNEYYVTRNCTKGTRLLVAWNGKNRQGRYIAAGTYLAVVTYTSADGEKQHSQKVLLGIRE